MPSIQRAAPVNRLLEALPERELRRFMAGCETVELAFAEVLCTPDERLSYVYFPTSSFISLVMQQTALGMPRRVPSPRVPGWKPSFPDYRKGLDQGIRIWGN